MFKPNVYMLLLFDHSLKRNELLLLNPTLAQTLLHTLINFIWRRCSHDLLHLILPLKVLHDGHAGLNKGPEALLDTLSVVVRATRGLASVDQTLLHGVLGAVEEEDEAAWDDALFESMRLVEFPWE